MRNPPNKPIGHKHAPKNAGRFADNDRRHHEKLQQANQNRGCCAATISNICWLMKKYPVTTTTLITLVIMGAFIAPQMMAIVPSSGNSRSNSNRVSEVPINAGDDTVTNQELPLPHLNIQNTPPSSATQVKRAEACAKESQKLASSEEQDLSEADEATEQERREIKEIVSTKVGFSKDAARIYKEKGYDPKPDRQLLMKVIVQLAASSDRTLSCRIRSVLEDPNFRVEIASASEIARVTQSEYYTPESAYIHSFNSPNRRISIMLNYFHFSETNFKRLYENADQLFTVSCSGLEVENSLVRMLKHEFQHAFVSGQNMNNAHQQEIGTPCKPHTMPGSLDCNDILKAFRSIEQRINTLLRLLKTPGGFRSSDEHSLLRRYKRALQNYTPEVFAIASLKSQADASVGRSMGDMSIEMQAGHHMIIRGGKIHRVLSIQTHPNDPKIIVMRVQIVGDDAPLAQLQYNLSRIGGSQCGSDFAFPGLSAVHEADAMAAEFLGTSVYPVLLGEFLNPIHLKRSDDSYTQCLRGSKTSLFFRETEEETSSDTQTAQLK